NSFGGADLRWESVRGVIGGCERTGGLRTAVVDGDGLALEEPGQARHERIRVTEIDGAAQPYQRGLRSCLEEPRKGWQHFGAVDRVRFRPELTQPHAGRSGGFERYVACGFRQRHDRDAAAVRLGARDEFVSRAQPNVPRRGGTPVVVDQNGERG